MPVIYDLTGQRFGTRTVVEKIVVNNRPKYKVLCDCGRESVTTFHFVKRQPCASCSRKKRFCKRGHDTQIVGRTVNKACRTCERKRGARVARRRYKEGKTWNLKAENRYERNRISRMSKLRKQIRRDEERIADLEAMLQEN